MLHTCMKGEESIFKSHVQNKFALLKSNPEVEKLIYDPNANKIISLNTWIN